MRSIALLISLPVLLTACGDDPDRAAGRSAGSTAVSPNSGPPTITSEPWGVTPEGVSVQLYTLRNANGMTVRVSDLGGIVTEVLVPDRNGDLVDVVLGYDALDTYLEGSTYFGAIVGRYANRIARGRFELDGTTYELATNDGDNHLHGGIRGFDRVLWDAFTVQSGPIPGSPYDVPGAGRASLILSYVSEAGEEGYPGSLDAEVTITLTNGNELKFGYEATTDAPTVVNLSHHGYWNLAGHDSGSILDHELELRASRYTPVDAGLIATGELRHVEGTPFDFRTPTRIGDRIDADDEQLRIGGGYDHNFVLDDWTGDGALRLAARLRDPVSGLALEVLTTEPGLQLYSANFLEESAGGKQGAVYDRRTGLCLEAQHFPDSPNRPEFPSTILRPGETYESETVYRIRAE
jgi:aldose 1-epimerase